MVFGVNRRSFRGVRRGFWRENGNLVCFFLVIVWKFRIASLVWIFRIVLLVRMFRRSRESVWLSYEEGCCWGEKKGGLIVF